VSDKPQRLHLHVHGRVQGVAFRAHARRIAQDLGLVGWVRNCRDASVELVAEGEAIALRNLREWCGHGPPAAIVSRVDEQWLPGSGEFTAFDIRF
jgi:acylphosphatase